MTLTSSYWTIIPMRLLTQADFSHSIHTQSFEKLARVLSKGAEIKHQLKDQSGFC